MEEEVLNLKEIINKIEIDLKKIEDVQNNLENSLLINNKIIDKDKFIEVKKELKHTKENIQNILYEMENKI